MFSQIKQWKVQDIAAPKVRTTPPNRVATLTQDARQAILRAGSTEIWGNIAYMDGWTSSNNHVGLYTVTPANPPTFGTITEGSFFLVGSAYIDGLVYGSYLYQSFFGAWVNHYTVNPETGEVVLDDNLPNYSLAPLATAQAQDGTVYGEFYAADGQSIEYGIVDYPNKTRTTIATATTAMCAMGITSDNHLYGIGSDGNLYQINTNDGTETLVGPTGLTLKDAEGYYIQSGVIDPKTNIFYWAAVDVNGSAGFYTVDLATGAATLYANYAEGSVSIYGMIVPPPLAEDGAPAKVDKATVTFNFPNGATTGTVNFTAPSLTYAGDALSGSLTYKVLVNDEVSATGTCNAGAAVSVNCTVPEGMNSFVITTGNDAGESPRLTIKRWIGYDNPKAPTEVMLTADNNTGVMNVSWTAPETGATAGIHEGYIGTLTYNVYRVSNGEETLVSSAQSGTTFTETLSIGQLTTYAYAIQAVNGSMVSEKASSNGAAIGSAYEVPYFEDFLTEDNANLYAILDANEDGRTWGYDKSYHRMRARYSSSVAADDWLFTPPIKLKAGKVYSFSIAAMPYMTSYPERFEVKMGQGTTVANMTAEVIPSTNVTTSGYVTYSNDNVTVAADGEYNFGIHCISDANMFYLCVDSVTVEIGPEPTAPAAPELTVTPGAQGAMEANLSIVAPTTSINGAAMTENMEIRIRRDGAEIHTLTNVAPGATVTYTDNDAALTVGNHEYQVIPYNSSDIGQKSPKVTVYIGPDTPASPENLKLDDNQTSVTMSWDAVGTVGANGGYVNPADVEYRVYDIIQSSSGLSLGDVLGTTSNTSYDITFNCDEGEQTFKYWGLDAKNAAGSSEINLAMLIAGVPYQIPAKESFAGKKLSYFWYYSSNTSNAVVLTYSDEPIDDDGGAIALTANQAGVLGSMGSGKFSLAGATKPTLVFSHKSTSTNNGLQVIIIKPDGSENVVKTINGSADYTTEKIDLAQFANERYIRFELRGDFAETGTFTFDNINVLDLLEYNLAIDMTAPETVVKGQTIRGKITVNNVGANAADNFTVTMTAGTDEFLSQTGSLASMGTLEIPYEYQTSTYMTGNTIDLKAKVAYANDLEPNDNEATATVALTTANVNPPTNLTGSQDENTNSVNLTWEAPATGGATTVTEDFESYAPWLIEGIGDWTTVCADGNGTYGINGLQFEHQYEAFAFIVFNPSELGLAENAIWAPHGGNQMLVSFVAAPEDNGGAAPQTDHWLISPQLSGNAQTIRFFAAEPTNNYGNESYEILYSTTGTATTDFQSLTTGNVTTVPATAGEWGAEITADLPAGARHFAIRHTSTDAFAMFVDDMTYETGASAPVGYNIYVDGELVGHVDGAGNVTWTGNPPTGDGAHTWGVTAVYGDGSESAPAEFELVTAIDEIFSEGKVYDIYTVDGILVRKQAANADGLKKGVYIINNKAVVVK